MPKNKITKQQVFDAAYKIAITDYPPTLTKIRDYLCVGSKTTIHKYFKSWKQKCFKSDYENNNCIKLDNSSFLEEKRILEQTLNKQINQNEHYASELINAEKTIIKLKEENHHLQTTNQELQLKLTETTASCGSLEKHYQDLKTALDLNNNETIKNQQQLIEKLQTEIKTINSTSVELIRQTSVEGHDLLMQEKLQTINLQAKIDSLNKQLVEINQQLTTALIKVQISQQHSAWQQRLIEKFINPEELQQLELRELRSTVKSRGSHGT